MDGHAISFGPYRLLGAQRLLLEGDRPVRLGSRAFDILAALVERAGEVVGKEQLIARAWPQTFVEEANLKIQVSALRRALGHGHGGNRYVITVPGRGYNFVAPVRREQTLRAGADFQTKNGRSRTRHQTARWGKIIREAHIKAE
jgi:DNA-binding winged helix-turn-helix (wHTH) protein